MLSPHLRKIQIGQCPSDSKTRCGRWRRGIEYMQNAPIPMERKIIEQFALLGDYLGADTTTAGLQVAAFKCRNQFLHIADKRDFNSERAIS